MNEFLEVWQNTLEQTFVVGLNFIEQQEISLFLSCLSFSWHGFVSIQKGIPNLNLQIVMASMRQK